VTKIETCEALSGVTKEAVVDLLYRMADDELMIGHRNSEWTGHAPILEEDIAFSSMAQDEIGHAQAYYELLHALGEADPDTLAFGRKPREYRCAALVALPKDDWAFTIVRQFFYDASEQVRLTELAECAFTPLAQLTTKLRSEEKYHMMHGRAWMLRLGKPTGESRGKMQAAVDKAYPYALGLFEPTEYCQPLTQAGICSPEDDLKSQWESAVAPVLADAGLRIPDSCKPVFGGRVGKHPPELNQLLDGLQLVYNIDPAAKW
jgi:ring-1,2-phenylacetyl-CoA epoxidase subunit PaaC